MCGGEVVQQGTVETLVLGWVGEIGCREDCFWTGMV